MNSISKTCSCCKQNLLATLEFFSKDKRSKDGLTGTCKKCMNEKSRSITEFYRVRNLLEPVKDQPSVLKVCPSCDIVKPLTRQYWYTSVTRKNGFHPVCSDCHKRDQKKSTRE